MHLITVRYDDPYFKTHRILVKLSSVPNTIVYFREVAEIVPTVAADSDTCFQMLQTQQVVPERRDDTGCILRPGGVDLHRDRYVLYRGVSGVDIREIGNTPEALAAEVRRLSQEDLGHVPPCANCKKMMANGGCCSAHDKILMCHLCYRRTHFVEVCGKTKTCFGCSAEGLDVLLSTRAAGQMIRERVG